MRTTVDLPNDLHRRVRAIAESTGGSLSETIVQLLRVALPAPGPVRVSTSPRTGLSVASIGRASTREDIRAVEDE